ncbi:hypothetical protein WDZ92_37350 [Nostoc sp. NIES-2111]
MVHGLDRLLTKQMQELRAAGAMTSARGRIEMGRLQKARNEAREAAEREERAARVVYSRRIYEATPELAQGLDDETLWNMTHLVRAPGGALVHVEDAGEAHDAMARYRSNWTGPGGRALTPGEVRRREIGTQNVLKTSLRLFRPGSPLKRCGRPTRTGGVCKAPAVSGSDACRAHGGGSVVIKRTRELLANPRIGPLRRERLLQRLDKANRNRSRAAREHRREAAEMEAKAAGEAARLKRLCGGEMPTALLATMRAACEEVRSHRAAWVECAIHRACCVLAENPGAHGRAEALDVIASVLELDGEEREMVRAAIWPGHFGRVGGPGRGNG